MFSINVKHFPDVGYTFIARRESGLYEGTYGGKLVTDNEEAYTLFYYLVLAIAKGDKNKEEL